MALAKQFALIVPPQVTPGNVTRVVAALEGGTDLNSTLTIKLQGDLVSAIPGGFVPIVIEPGAFGGSATFTVLGSQGPRLISTTHTGGNPGMGDPSARLVALGPDFVPPSGLQITHLDLPAGQQPTWVGRGTPDAKGYTPPSGKGHVLMVELLGKQVPSDLTLIPTDGAGGEFVPPKRVIRPPMPGDQNRELGAWYYFPKAPGMRTVTFNHTGLPGPLAGNSISLDANL